MGLYFGSSKSGKVNVIKKERYDEGYELGYNEGYEVGRQDFGTKATEIGTELILENVNEHKHTVSVNLTSDTITDFSGVKVKTKGENLFNQEELLTDSDFTKEEYNGFECFKLVGTKVNHTFPCEVPAGQFTFSLDIAHPETTSNFSVVFIYEDGTSIYFYEWNKTTNPEFVRISKTGTVSKKIVSIQLRSYGAWSFRPYYIKDFMVNVGAKKDYEPYAEPAEYQSNINGIVEGVESISSTMYLSTDTEGVTINAEYYLDGAKELEKYKNIILDLGGEI